MDNLDLAIILKRYTKSETPVDIYYADRASLGKINEDGSVFSELLTGKKYLFSSTFCNEDCDEYFNFPLKYDEIANLISIVNAAYLKNFNRTALLNMATQNYLKVSDDVSDQELITVLRNFDLHYFDFNGVSNRCLKNILASKDIKGISNFSKSELINAVMDCYEKDKEEVYSTYFKQISERIYFFDEQLDLCSFPLSEASKFFGVPLDIPTVEEFNEFNEIFADSEEDAISEYLDLLHEIDNSTQNNASVKPIEEPVQNYIDKIKKSIIAQDEAVKDITVAIYKNYLFDNPTISSKIFMYGPTGCGKTALINTIGKVFDYPVYIEDMTRFTEAGYHGADVDDILVHLYNNANQNLERAQKSIVFLDEIDKKASAGEERVNKDGVLKSLLKIVEGGVFDVQIDQFKSIQFDTSHLTVIVGGAFTDLYAKKELDEKRILGFGEAAKPKEEIHGDIDYKDFEKYGIPMEFLGRFKTVVRLKSLDKKDLISILKNSDISAINAYKEEFKKKGIELQIPESIYEKIADLAIKDGTGARALNKYIDVIFKPVLFDYFNNVNQVQEISIGENIVEESTDYKLIKKVKND